MEVEQSVSTRNIFTFKQTKESTNKLVNKNIPGVEIDQISHVVYCRDSQTESTVVRSQQPLQNDLSLSYFEVEVLGATNDDSISIGLMAKDNTNKQILGKSTNSFGYYKGEFFLSKKKVGAITPHQKLQNGDYIGMGVNCLKRTFFVVKNGKIVISNLPIPINWTEYYPAVGISKQDQKLKFIFNERGFKFKYEQLKRQIEKQTQGEIQKEGITNGQIYPLIFEYLSFHGYNKTLKQLQEREKDIYKIPKLCKHPGISRPSIDLNSKQNLQINQDIEMNQPLKSKLRNRFMSERLDEENSIFQPLRRKNTELAVDPERKQSFFENISNVSNYDMSQKNIVEQQEQKIDKQEPLDENQKFLLTSKFQIVNLIKQKKIEEALQIIEREIPELIEDQLILAFMKAHIFLRIVKEGNFRDQVESNLAAIAYSQKEKQIFSHHKDTLFPFYVSSKDKVQWKPLKYIYNALAYNAKGSKEQTGDILSHKQFELFSSYIRSTIHKKLGYLGCSRLAFFINNTKKVLQKIKDYKGMSCGIQLNI